MNIFNPNVLFYAPNVLHLFNKERKQYKYNINMEESKLYEKAHTNCSEFVGVRMPEFLKTHFKEKNKSIGVEIREALYKIYLASQKQTISNK